MPGERGATGVLEAAPGVKPDRHTSCPACAMQVRNLFAVAQVVLAIHTLPPDSEEFERARDEQLENLRLAIDALAPFVEAHLANQDHALSDELADARFPRLAWLGPERRCVPPRDPFYRGPERRRAAAPRTEAALVEFARGSRRDGA